MKTVGKTQVLLFFSFSILFLMGFLQVFLWVGALSLPYPVLRLRRAFCDSKIKSRYPGGPNKMRSDENFERNTKEN